MEPQPDQIVEIEPPAELEFADGSRLVREDASSSSVRCRVEGSDRERISLEDALSLSGEPFAGYRLDRRDCRE
jgi:hypothetical protein